MTRHDEIRALAEKGRGKKWGHPDRVAFRDRADEAFALEALARVEELKAALRRYGRHSCCAIAIEGRCTCGLGALLGGTERVDRGMSALPPSLRVVPTIPWGNQTIEQLTAERDYWAEKVRTEPGFASAKVADSFRKSCESWLARRHVETTPPPELRTALAAPEKEPTVSEDAIIEKAMWRFWQWPGFQQWWLSLEDGHGGHQHFGSLPTEPFEDAILPILRSALAAFSPELRDDKIIEMHGHIDRLETAIRENCAGCLAKVALAAAPEPDRARVTLEELRELGRKLVEAEAKPLGVGNCVQRSFSYEAFSIIGAVLAAVRRLEP